MADYFTQFSFELKTTEAEQDWLDDEVERLYELEEIPVRASNRVTKELSEYEAITCDISVSHEDDKTYISHEVSGDVYFAAQLVKSFFEKFDRDDVINIHFANSCSRKRVGAFSGGFLTVSKDEILDYYTEN